MTEIVPFINFKGGVGKTSLYFPTLFTYGESDMRLITPIIWRTGEGSRAWIVSCHL
jgi:hypothetical protein